MSLFLNDYKNELNLLKKHMCDNSGDENMANIILIVIAFVVGGIVAGFMTLSFDKNGAVANWMRGAFKSSLTGDKIV